ncbi:MAG TPA: class I SAM-dependent methyltransferase, partial [Tepidisphaeraceae bacterium]|nr:class I SAM-dependent methyltransferase [Tepidisphaeraceae bacterium]
MEFTGERFMLGQHGNIKLEHLHRYLSAERLAPGKDVLDIACGEGYGSAILARSARKVFGVDISAEAVDHARRHYVLDNLDFRPGSASAIPLPDKSIDLVVSFETIEHHDQHDAMMAEIKRVLRPSGVLLISSPDKRVYSELPNYTNPYHVKELSRSEFFELLQRYFSNITGYGQRVIHGSAILADDIQTATASFREQDDTTQGSAGLIDSMYLIALASDGPLTPIPSGVFEGPIEENESYAALNQALAAANVAYATADKARAAAEEAQVAVKEQLAAQRAISAGLSAR